jgi:hypothetical protein
MTWHKNDVRYNPNKIVHPADGEAWKSFNANHRGKDEEARNVRVALAIDGFNPYEMMLAPYTFGPCLLSPSISPLGPYFNGKTYS